VPRENEDEPTKTASLRGDELLHAIDLALGDEDDDLHGHPQDEEPYWIRAQSRPYWGSENHGDEDVSEPVVAPKSEPRQRLGLRDLSAEADIVPRFPPGYRRDGRGLWTYEATGKKVQGARDVTLDTLFPFGRVMDEAVRIPVAMAREWVELAWVERIGERVFEVDGTAVFVVGKRDWQLRSGVVITMDAPELLPQSLVSAEDIAAARGVKLETVYADKSRGRLPLPVNGSSARPLWSRGIVAIYLHGRRGWGWRRQRVR
jgi:hypothetical protein